MQKDCEWSWDKGEAATIIPTNWSGSLELEACIEQLRKEIDKGEKRDVRVKIPSGFSTKEKKGSLEEAIAYIDEHILKFKLVGRDCEWSYDKGEAATLLSWEWSGPLSFDDGLAQLREEKHKNITKGYRVKVPSGFRTMEKIFKDVDSAIAYLESCSPGKAKEEAERRLEECKAQMAEKEKHLEKLKTDKAEFVEQFPAAAASFKVEQAEKDVEAWKNATAKKGMLEERLPDLEKAEKEAASKLHSSTLLLHSKADQDKKFALSLEKGLFNSAPKNGSKLTMLSAGESGDLGVWTLDDTGCLRLSKHPDLALCVREDGLKEGGEVHMWTVPKEDDTNDYCHWKLEDCALKSRKDPEFALHVKAAKSHEGPERKAGLEMRRFTGRGLGTWSMVGALSGASKGEGKGGYGSTPDAPKADALCFYEDWILNATQLNEVRTLIGEEDNIIDTLKKSEEELLKAKQDYEAEKTKLDKESEEKRAAFQKEIDKATEQLNDVQGQVDYWKEMIKDCCGAQKLTRPPTLKAS